jgi:hypothetical protein
MENPYEFDILSTIPLTSKFLSISIDNSINKEKNIHNKFLRNKRIKIDFVEKNKKRKHSEI